MDKYSIIIPIHNEIDCLKKLLKSIENYFFKGHEIIIIDDGSTDGSTQVLENSKLINLITIRNNKGKGYAIRQGLKIVKYDSVIIFDGDLELNPSEISKLMILDKKKKIYSAMGYRFKSLNPFKSNFDWGNFMFTSFFNILFKSNHRDILCCAKAFYLNQSTKKYLTSNGFDIDIELSSVLTINNNFKKIPQVLLSYNRRTIEEGKKLQISDGWNILAKTISMCKYF